jgi:tetratricopeptide (TPR) repeat protein
VSTFFDRHGYNTDSRAVRELALVSARSTADRQGQISTLVGLGMADMRLGDHVLARQNLDTALRLATEDEFDRGQASALHQLGRLEMMRSDPAAALQLFRRGLPIADRLDDDEGRCWYYCRIGEALRATEQYDEALVNLHEARRLAQRIGEESAHAGILIQLGSVYRDRGDHSAADAHLQRARTIAEAIPDLAATAQAHIELAELHTARHTEAALRHAQQAVHLCQQTHNRIDEARALTTLGGIQHASGDPDNAVLTWRQAVGLHHLTGNSAHAALLQAKIDSVPPQHGVIVPTSRTGSEPASGPVRGSTTH